MFVKTNPKHRFGDTCSQRVWTLPAIYLITKGKHERISLPRTTAICFSVISILVHVRKQLSMTVSEEEGKVPGLHLGRAADGRAPSQTWVTCIFCQPSHFADEETEAGGEMICPGQVAHPSLCVPLPISFPPCLKRPPSGLSSLHTWPCPGLLSALLAPGEEYGAMLASQCFQTGTFRCISTSLLRRCVGPCTLELDAESWEVGTRLEWPSGAGF